KKLGDGVLAIFDNAESAVYTMAIMLRNHASRVEQWPPPFRMGLRVGLASGKLVEVDGDCYGDAVNVASRLCEMAGPAEIWATEATVLFAGDRRDVKYRKLGKMEIRGKAEVLVLYQVEWRENEEADSLTMQAPLLSHFATLGSVVEQIHFAGQGVNMSFTSLEVPIQLGRAANAHLCMNDPRVSRLHARMEWHNSGFVLTDMSSFGTWVRFEGSNATVRLRRSSCILHGAGDIALGVAFTEADAPVVQFQITGAKA
ncbi:MAG: adenylate/guanylate cyclase domain-containing protein, partial [Burkholderiaceae bacterium]|nr:adenylate/guanylate cyclase domain-containing protein [Burkholderiaceae bacterium]